VTPPNSDPSDDPLQRLRAEAIAAIRADAEAARRDLLARARADLAVPRFSLSDVVAAAGQELREAASQIGRAISHPDFARNIGKGVKALMIEAGPIIGEQLVSALDEAFPPNWRTGGVAGPLAIATLMRESGLSLAWTPPVPVLEQIMATDDLEERRRILLAAEGIITDDLDAFIRAADHPKIEHLREAARQALESYRSGYFWAAQALSSTAISSALHHNLGHESFKDARDEFEKRHPREAGLRDFRLAAVLSAVLRALDRYRPPDDPVPDRFNRHASSHYVGPPQFNQPNSLNAVMLLVSLLRELDSIAKLEDRHEALNGEPS
jgi:hypothetical protein